MKLIVIGINHKTAPVALRGRMSFGEDLSAALINAYPLTQGIVIISTCNRSEIYAYIPDGFEQKDNEYDQRLLAWLCQFKNIKSNELTPYLYVYKGNKAMTHWLRVAVGLDSMILGEPQILGQIKSAVALSQDLGVIGADFNTLIQKLFYAAKIIRRDTALGKQATSLGAASAKLVTQIFDAPQNTTLLIVAAGEMNRLVAHNVAALGMTNILICNRSPERAAILQKELIANGAGRRLNITLLSLDNLSDGLMQADIVSSCSGSMEILISAAMIKNAMKIRKNRPMLLVDLAVPCDIEAAAEHIDNVYLYSIDDLEHVIAGNVEARKQAAVEAEVLVGQLIAQTEIALQAKQAGEYINAYRNHALQKKQECLALAQKQLASGKDGTQVLQMLANNLTNTLAHPPTKLLAQLASLDDTTQEIILKNLLGSYRKKPSQH